MISETLYAAYGNKYVWKITKPEGGTKYHVRKYTRSGNKFIGHVVSFVGEFSAKDYANRQAAKDVKPVRGFV